MPVGTLTRSMPWSDHQSEKHRGRYYGRYMGFVRDRNDPKKLGRCRIHVPSILGRANVPDNWLDWCRPSSSGLFVPPLGAPVWVTFENGQVTHGVYSHGWILGNDAGSSAAHPAGKGEEDPTWVQEATYAGGGRAGATISATLPQDTARDSRPEYPYNKVFESESGHVFELDDTPGRPRARYRHPSGTVVLIDSAGNVQIRSAGGIYHESDGDYVIALKPGSTYKVIYPQGGAISVGAAGVHVGGNQATLMGRTVKRTGDAI